MNYTELDWRWAILLRVAIRDGLLRAVADRCRKPEDVAGELGLDARAVYVVLSALAELWVLEEGEEGFRLRDEHRAPLLEPQGPEYVGGSVVHRFELIGSWSQMGEILRTGDSDEDRTSACFGGTATFIQAMRRAPSPGQKGLRRRCYRGCPKGEHLGRGRGTRDQRRGVRAIGTRTWRFGWGTEGHGL